MELCTSETVKSAGKNGTASRFYLADCIDVFSHLAPGSVDVIVTSPPYNMGIRYNRYQDTLSQDDYLRWTDAWTAAAVRVLARDGSLFLNVGARPSDPWTALDVAQAVRSRLRLPNIIHWIKSIAIDRDSAGAAAGLTPRRHGRSTATFLNDRCFHFTRGGATHRSPLALPIRISRTSAGNLASGARALPGQHVVHRTKRFSAATAIVRRRRSPPPEQCLKLHGLSRIAVMDRYRPQVRPWPVRAWASTSLSEIDEMYVKVREPHAGRLERAAAGPGREDEEGLAESAGESRLARAWACSPRVRAGAAAP